MSGAERTWSLDAPSFERLLAFLDRDRDAAAQRYEDIRRRLLKLFQWRGCDDPERLTDETIDRVAKRLSDGVTVAANDPYVYVHGVANNVVREQWRTPSARLETIDPVHPPPVEQPRDTEELEAARARRLACLGRCLANLPAADRGLLLEYHAGDRHIERRQQMALRLGVPMNALRIRMHRVRAAVERCIAGCLGGARP